MMTRSLSKPLIRLALAASCVSGIAGPLAGGPRNPPAAPDFLDARGRHPELMLFGTFHFDDQGQDAYKPRFRLDISSPERQHQIEDLVDRLARFRPTKVAVEAGLADQPRLDSLYAAFVAGTYRLGANEVYQIGFRLAKRAGLKGVQAVDVDGRSYMTEDEVQAKIAKLGLNMDTLMSRIASDPWEARYRQLYAYDDSLKTVRTLQETLLYLNSAERLRIGHGAYSVGAFKLGRDTDYLGPDDVTQWYNRNLRIFSNLQSMTSGPDERIVLIIGAGHVPLLRFLAQSSPEYRLRELSEFLSTR